MLEESGGNLVEEYLTFGPYDAVVMTEAKDDDDALRGALRYGLAGNGRSVTMRVFNEAEAVRVTKSLGYRLPRDRPLTSIGGARCIWIGLAIFQVR